MISISLSICRRVEEFKECGDLDMMTQYVKDVQSVQKKMSECVETIGFINEVGQQLVSFYCISYFPLFWRHFFLNMRNDNQARRLFKRKRSSTQTCVSGSFVTPSCDRLN
jgi:hypothetical protein